MPYFRNRPVVKEALQYDGTSESAWAILQWSDKRIGLAAHNCLAIPTLEGTMMASPGDWVIKGLKGEFYPCKPDVFEKTYELVDEMALLRET